MDDTKYENQDGVLKVSQPVVTLIPMDELLASKNQIENEIQAYQDTFNEQMDMKETRLAAVTNLISQAKTVGIAVPIGDAPIDIQESPSDIQSIS